MSVQDPHVVSRPAPSWGVRRFTPSWRWLTEAMWWGEHAFGRARADARPEEDTRVRIFVILSAFWQGSLAQVAQAVERFAQLPA